MQNECYRGVVKTAAQLDAEYPQLLIVTMEANGYAVWHFINGGSGKPLEWFANRDEAIEYAVDRCQKMRGDDEHRI